MGTSESRKTVRIGVYLPVGCQLLDMACIDIFATISHEYLSLLDGLAPSPIVNLAPSIRIYYIGAVEPGEQIDLTAGVRIQCTHHFSDPEVQPGKLDIVLVPGPDPTSTYEKPVTDWLAAQAASKDTDILSVCTGIYLCGEAGLLKGKKVCGPRGLQSQLKSKFEGATWFGEDLRWIQDGNFWSCGGITNGNDLVTAYIRESARFPGPLAEFGAVLTDTGDRAQKYATGKAMFTLGIVWQVIKAAFMGIGRPKHD